MYKFLFILILILVNFNINAQESTLVPNTNIDAKELKHALNKTNDSLLLESTFMIHKVEIFNSGFNKVFEISGQKIQISLVDIPLGRQSIAVFVNRKIIMITLLRGKPYKETPKIVLPEIKQEIRKPIDKNRIRDSLVKDNKDKMNKIRDSLEIANLREITRIKDSLTNVLNDNIETLQHTENQKVIQPTYKETVITEYDTTKVKNIINRKHTYIEENVVNETFDTIIYGDKDFKPKDKTTTIKNIPYDISTKNNDYRVIKQTREDFRKYNLRPNGTPYPEKKDN